MPLAIATFIVRASTMRRVYVYKPANINAPLFAFQVRPASGLIAWTDAQKADWTLAVAQNNLVAVEEGFAAACASLGNANRLTGRMRGARRRYQAEAFRRINIARKQLRQARAALAVAMAAPTLASDQLAA